MSGGANALRDRLGNKLFRAGNRIGKRVAEREVGCDRGGVRAACAVEGEATEEWCREHEFCAAVVEKVDGFASAFEVAAFDQGGAPEGFVDSASSVPEVVLGFDSCADQLFGFLKVGRDQACSRQQALLDGRGRGLIDQLRATGRNHYRVDYESVEFCDHSYQFGGKQHASLDRLW